jgi:ADP-ribosyl-[dinitrogen reductase] hydrolase
MRAAPLGLYPDIEVVLSRCRLQAALTHNTPGGIHAAQAVSLMMHYVHYRLGPKRELPAFLSRHVPGEWAIAWRGKVGRPGMASVRAALTAIVQCDRMSDLLRMCVDFTGDVDTVAAVALAAGSCCKEIEQDLPAHLHAGLERGPFGYDYLADLDRRLFAAVW